MDCTCPYLGVRCKWPRNLRTWRYLLWVCVFLACVRGLITLFMMKFIILVPVPLITPPSYKENLLLLYGLYISSNKYFWKLLRSGCNVNNFSFNLKLPQSTPDILFYISCICKFYYRVRTPTTPPPKSECMTVFMVPFNWFSNIFTTSACYLIS